MPVDEEPVAYVTFAAAHAAGIAVLARAEGWPTFGDEDRVRRLFSAPGTCGVVAVREEPGRAGAAPVAVVGAGHLLTDGHHAYLTFLAVRADLRGRGIGRRLVREAFEASGAVRIDLLSTPDSNGFYRGLPHTDFAGFRLYPSSGAVSPST
ncbi:MAG TPA: GNAT family N-acetyltransferase [Actinopolymorphaceae bacterium]